MVFAGNHAAVQSMLHSSVRSNGAAMIGAVRLNMESRSYRPPISRRQLRCQGQMAKASWIRSRYMQKIAMRALGRFFLMSRAGARRYSPDPDHGLAVPDSRPARGGKLLCSTFLTAPSPELRKIVAYAPMYTGPHPSFRSRICLLLRLGQPHSAQVYFGRPRHHAGSICCRRSPIGVAFRRAIHLPSAAQSTFSRAVTSPAGGTRLNRLASRTWLGVRGFWRPRLMTRV